MKPLLSLLALYSMFETAYSAVDCNIQISRDAASSLPAVCTNFDGVNAESYRQWYDDNAISNKYPGMVYLQGSDPDHPENGAAVHWKIDGDYVHLAMAARATGWVAFGIGEAGGMLGADMAIFEAANPDIIVDAYTTDERFPVTDDCPSNWELLSFDDTGGFIIIEFKRLLDTGDSQDKIIEDDSSALVPPHRVIAAWGNSTEVGYHGLNRARGQVRFHGSGDEQSTFAQVMSTDAESSFVVASVDHEISSNETEYWHTCFSRDSLIENQGVPNTTSQLNIIGFEPLIQTGNEAYVHHYIIYASGENRCPEGDEVFGQEIAYVWAPGENSLTYPSNLGAPLFGEDGFQTFTIEVHYNNPQGKTGIIDSSGVRVYWTSQPREFQIGIMSVGDPNVGAFGQPVGDGLSYHSFECPSNCSAVVGQEVTVLREYLHMHHTGARIVNEQIRNGEVIRKGAADYWEFDQNGNLAVQEEQFTIKPGDGFRTTCYYDGTGRTFGLGSNEEMCMAFLYYYPRTQIRIEEMGIAFAWTCGYNLGFDPCDASYESRMLSSSDEFDRVFGVSPEGSCAELDNDPNDEEESSASKYGVAFALLCMVFGMFGL